MRSYLKKCVYLPLSRYQCLIQIPRSWIWKVYSRINIYIYNHTFGFHRPCASENIKVSHLKILQSHQYINFLFQNIFGFYCLFDLDSSQLDGMSTLWSYFLNIFILDYIWIILVCVYCNHILNTGVCWNQATRQLPGDLNQLQAIFESITWISFTYELNLSTTWICIL